MTSVSACRRRPLSCPPSWGMRAEPPAPPQARPSSHHTPLPPGSTAGNTSTADPFDPPSFPSDTAEFMAALVTPTGLEPRYQPASSRPPLPTAPARRAAHAHTAIHDGHRQRVLILCGGPDARPDGLTQLFKDAGVDPINSDTANGAEGDLVDTHTYSMNSNAT